MWEGIWNFTTHEIRWKRWRPGNYHLHCLLLGEFFSLVGVSVVYMHQWFIYTKDLLNDFTVFVFAIWMIFLLHRSCTIFGFNYVYCRLDTTAQFVSVWWRTLQTIWITLMERNVCSLFDMFPLIFFFLFCVIALLELALLIFILMLSPRSKSFGHVYASRACFSPTGTT